MRSACLVAVLALIASGPLVAQGQAELDPFVTWQWGGRAALINGDLEVAASENYGASLGVEVRRGMKAEVFYSYQPTQLIFRPFFGVPETLSDLKVHYMHVGGRAELGNPRAKLSGWGGASAGATLFHPSNPQYRDEWRFSFRFSLGGKFMFSQRIGLHGRLELLAPINWAGVCIGCGGSGVAVGSTTVQGSVGGGLVIAF